MRGMDRSESLARLVESLPRARVAVAGDLMLDVHVRGSVSRVSQEAPIPVLLAGDESAAPGGAANVACKVAELGGRVLRPPQDIPTVGRFCVLQDPQGAVICAITYAER